MSVQFELNAVAFARMPKPTERGPGSTARLGKKFRATFRSFDSEPSHVRPNAMNTSKENSTLHN